MGQQARPRPQCRVRPLLATSAYSTLSGAATTIDGVLSQARLLSQWDQSTGWRDARMAMIGHFILEGLKFVVGDDHSERDLAGVAVKE